jgi:hypothetical protein
MAKKLLVGQYTFDASERSIRVQGSFPLERFLVITNVTQNEIIYNFAAPTKSGSSAYLSDSDETLLSLVYDTTSHSDTDKLQIFVEQDYTEITPAEDILDPVGKLRVSNPANLIDTDFEYGLQSTKWETLQTVKNIPTVYSSTGDAPIDGITSIDAVSGSKSVKVTTSIPHGLGVGDPISVQGVSQYQAEGFFIVTNVPSTTEFFFQLDVDAVSSGDISGSYTTIVPGKFFEGSTLPVSTADGAVTDGADPSTLTVTTEETHGFAADTKVYIRNTVGPRTLTIADSTATAADGRPFVDTVSSFTTTSTVGMSTDTGRASFRKAPVVTYDWESTYTHYLDASEINTSTNRITWTGHGFRDKYTVVFQCPYYGASDAGLTDGTVYYVKVIDTDTIELHTTNALSAAVSLSALNNTYGLCRLSLVYKVEYASGNVRRTPYGVWANQGGTGNTGSVTSFNSGNVTHSINLTALGWGNPTTVVVNSHYAEGDLNGTNEYLAITIAGTTYNNHTDQQGGGYYRMKEINGAASLLDGKDVSSALSVSNGNTYLTFQIDPTTAVNAASWATSNSSYYQYYLNLTYSSAASSPSESDLSVSGGDLYDLEYGLGSSQPSNIIAFQGRTPGSSSTNGSLDSFSYLSNQRDYGRYGTLAIRNPTINITSTGWNNTNGDGTFEINYSNNTSTFGTSSNIFYVFCNPLTTDRNTIYIPSHGITESTAVTVNVDSTDYSNGQRFAFTNTSSGAIDQTQQFSGTATPVNIDVIRLQTSSSPNTDDIVRVPENFTLQYTSPNPTYNSIYVANHKVTGSVNGVYDLISGTVISPLVDGDTYQFVRINDNRLNISATSGSANSTSVEQTGSTNTAADYNIDIETAFGFAPTACTISSLEFRGDVGARNEYIDLQLKDSGGNVIQEWRIARTEDQGDSQTYVTSGEFGNNVNISSYLFNDAGNSNKKSFKMNIAPSSAVDYGPGGGPWWGIKFNLTASTSDIILTGTGSGTHNFNLDKVVGAYDGVFPITATTSDTFTLSSDFKIPARDYTFTSTDVDAVNDVITLSDSHNFVTGEEIVYNAGGNTSILPVGTGNTVYVIGTGNNSFKLASSSLDARNNTALDISAQSGTHTFTSSNLIKNIQGAGNVSTTNATKVVTGTDTNFLTNFKRFDKIYIDNGTYIEEKTVDNVTTNTDMTLFEDATSTVSGNNYYYATQIALRPDGYNLHKPFDGGVDITAGTSPNSRICRQTRKYFRYQSGKGVQTSIAVSFNPPKLVKQLIKASGTTATVDTQEQHNLKVGDSIRVAGATVDFGTNYYNGNFTVVTTPTPFQFTYTMDGTPTDVRAGGFPNYVRNSWTDSFVRAGMFDDQNGFFYEFDGQNLNCVRRSSTLQIAGNINVTRGSHVVSGDGTSFTTQLSVGNFVVIRGQSYQITEISSDVRMIVQPAYRGLDATRVKATLTVDTKTPQSQWNIDKADGTGFTGFNLDLTKIQMAYMDYSWYGAGKIRYGFKDAKGHVRYMHEYIHNNKLDESYFRSGNLPARYEIENGPNATTAPTLFHFGTSVIMDGTFDDDKAYQFTGQSRPFAFTTGANDTVTSTAESSFAQITLDGNRVYVYSMQLSQVDAEKLVVGHQFSGGGLPAGTYVTQVTVDGATSKVFVNYPATSADPTGGTEYLNIANATTFTAGESTAVELQRPIPLISVRLAPSVDSSLTGALGEREVINRMQLRLRQASVTTNKDVELFLIQNCQPSAIPYEKAQRPSLSQVIKHVSGDTILGGTTIYTTKVSAGSLSVDLAELLEIGNSILGGDNIFPAGPDLLTLAVQAQNPSGLTLAAPLQVSGNISWSESQA